MLLSIFLILLTLSVLFLLTMIYIGFRLSHKAFQGRFDGGGDYFPYFSQLHPHWRREPVSFPAKEGHTLRGFLFSYPEQPVRGLLVLFHGYGMSLDDYLPECEYFSRRGYLVFAFDGSGTGHSEGTLMGLPQHILDLDAALSYISSIPRLQTLPLLLYGHSWGGFACDALGAIHSYPIRGIVSAAGFAASISALEAHSRRHYGLLSPIAMLGVQLWQRRHYGVLASITAIDGLRKQTCPVLITQSRDDSIVPFQENYGAFYRAFSKDSRKRFLPLEGHNHNLTTPPEIDSQKRKLLKPLRAGNPSPQLLETLNQLKAHVDYELLEQFADFFDACIR